MFRKDTVLLKLFRKDTVLLKVYRVSEEVFARLKSRMKSFLISIVRFGKNSRTIATICAIHLLTTHN